MSRPRFEGVPKPLRMYIIHKIRMLEREFLIQLSDSDIKHFKELRTESEVDRYAHQILKDKL